jgi:hypothetical protein
MLDLHKLEHEIIAGHERRQAAIKTRRDQLEQLVVALEDATDPIASQLMIFEKYRYYPTVEIKKSSSTATMEVFIRAIDTRRGFIAQLQTNYQPLDTTHIEFLTGLANRTSWAYTRLKRDPQAIAASFIEEHKRHLERALTRVVMD